MGTSPKRSKRMPTPPQNVRYVPGVGWQVLLETQQQWYLCHSEQDACFIASGMRLAEAVNNGSLSGQETADDLDAVAVVTILAVGQVEAQPIIDAALRARAAVIN